MFFGHITLIYETNLPIQHFFGLPTLNYDINLPTSTLSVLYKSNISFLNKKLSSIASFK
jgi:hypothetical protein